MLDRVNGPEQVTKYWSKAVSGGAESRYTLVRDGTAWMGRQTQRMAFTGGSGEVGITNHGLYRSGIALEAGKPYDGVLRVRSVTPVTIYMSLRDGNTILAESEHKLRGDGSYEKVEFELTPRSGTVNGSFGISLKQVGEIDLGFAFLQPGVWGRVPGGWPIRTMFTDALKAQGITAFRYNGSMVDVGADTHLYRWKKMRGPVDERRVTFRSGFNAYATHSFGFIEMLQAAEAIDAVAIIGMSMNESGEDIRDFVEYVNGPVTSTWGAVRATDGHPKPYGLKYIQVDNERNISRGYVEAMKKFALAAWEADPRMSIMTSLNLGADGYIRGGSERERHHVEGLRTRAAGPQDNDWARRRVERELRDAENNLGEQYRLASELAGWFIAQGKGHLLSWDPHYSGAIEFADRGEGYLNEMGITLQRELAKEIGVSFEKIAQKVESLAEVNPMLGHRGCRLGNTYPEITEMQTRAIIEAAMNIEKRGIPVKVEIMVPLVGNHKELRYQKNIIKQVAEEVFLERNDRIKFMIGTMIEVPRAAVTANEIAEHAEFFSFGTNDLTQMTLGFSRDDIGKFLPVYLEKGILKADPFQILDQKGVGALIKEAVFKGRDVRPELKCGICGEHGGEPSSVEFCHFAGLNYVSCSPFRVPIARLAAAHAALR